MWPFTRKPTPPAPIDRRDWNEDWKVGDTAECVVERDQWHKETKPWEIPGNGDKLVVKGFAQECDLDGALNYFLLFDEYPNGLTTYSFRKIPALTAKPGQDNPRKVKA